MSTSSTTSSSSILAARPRDNLDTSKPTRVQPPRLQHSPSLPNIWFPPHSGPIPPQFEDATREPLQRPSTPLAINSGPTPSSSTPVDLQWAMEHRGTLSFDDLFMPNTQPLKIQRRRRVDREHGHSLLTPPLTPSSSLRTATSIDSASAVEPLNDADTSSEPHGDDANHESTRFLLVGNISSQASSEALRSAIIDALTSTNSEPSEHPNTLSVPTTGAQPGFLNNESIKGVFVRCQKSHGIVMLAFFDPRHAARAKEILSLPSTGPLADCVSDELAEDGSEPWIFCEFISAEKLAEIIGPSAFLASTDGSFSLVAEGREAATEYDGKEVRVVDDRSVDEDNSLSEDAVSTTGDGADNTTLAGDGINLKMLKSLLKSFGSVRSFSLAKDVDPIRPHVKVFHVEYYDLRHANSAYAALQGQVLFGMKLQVSGREDQTPQGQHVQEAQFYPPAPSDVSGNSPKNVIPFPTSAGMGAYPNDGPLQLGPPGQYSNTRQRFSYTDPARSRPRSVSAGHDGYMPSFSPSPTPISSPHPGIPSPTFFYTSMPAGGSDSSAPSQDHQPRRPSGHFAFDINGRPHGLPGNNSDGGYHMGHLQNHEQANRMLEGNSGSWEGESPVAHLQGSHQDCYYCPSRGASGDCYTYPPRSPLYSPPVQRPPLVPPSLPLSPSASMFGTGYNYDNNHTLPANHAMNMNMNMANSFEQPMISLPRSAPGEAWFSTPNMVSLGFHGVPFYPPPVQVPASYGTYCPPLKLEPPLQIDSPLHMNEFIYRTDPSSASSPSSRLTGRPTSARSSANNLREPSSPPERNQLNLARIEDGQDTRTTVMIKNIPNKMSDKDLIAFIAKVCSRKIDFLYLRMDFQNGCNVGYAFVNFIDVQDLLCFAKKKLGEKWGKEALVEKFKNSCIMDEREAWRPKIFYSEPGPEQGLPEPFPAPTHLRRKERSFFNRGALYVPGVGRGSANPQMAIQNPIRRTPQREVQRSHYLSADRRRQDAEEVDDHASPIPFQIFFFGHLEFASGGTLIHV
ncbi:hypothetical protein L208DRAFT_1375985 [Tricholoma matsutake]|nr:hypothetical protein L208DRAFT_1375985 [Tricholoma matsutake 945]